MVANKKIKKNCIKKELISVLYIYLGDRNMIYNSLIDLNGNTPQ